MKIKSIIIASLLTLGATANAAEPAPLEEKRGAIAGMVVGAAAGGPIGAGVGAMLGGGVIGKMFATHRENRELRQDLASVDSQQLDDKAELERTIALLNQDLDKLLQNQRAGLSHQEAPIQFRTGSAVVEAHYHSQLDRIANLLSRNPDANVVLSGFADRRGPEEKNQSLSEDRASNVKSYLEDRGVTASQIVTVAYGESRPISEGESIEDNFFDRRVVMSLNLDTQLATR